MPSSVPRLTEYGCRRPSEWSPKGHAEMLTADARTAGVRSQPTPRPPPIDHDGETRTRLVPGNAPPDTRLVKTDERRSRIRAVRDQLVREGPPWTRDRARDFQTV